MDFVRDAKKSESVVDVVVVKLKKVEGSCEFKPPERRLRYQIWKELRRGLTGEGALGRYITDDKTGPA